MIYENLKDFIAAFHQIKWRSHSIVKYTASFPAAGTMSLQFTFIEWSEDARWNCTGHGVIHRCDIIEKSSNLPGDNPFGWISAAAWVQAEKRIYKSVFEMESIIISEGEWTEDDLFEKGEI